MKKFKVGIVFEMNESFKNALSQMYNEIEFIEFTEDNRRGRGLLQVDLLLFYKKDIIKIDNNKMYTDEKFTTDLLYYYYSNVPKICLGEISVLFNYFQNGKIIKGKKSTHNFFKTYGTGIFNKLKFSFTKTNDYLLYSKEEHVLYSEFFSYNDYEFTNFLKIPKSYIETVGELNLDNNIFSYNTDIIQLETLMYILQTFKIY